MKYMMTFENFENDDIDIETIRTAFTDIRDEFDLEEIDEEKFIDYTARSPNIDKFNFNNSYRIWNSKDSIGVSLLVKSKKYEKFTKSMLKGEIDRVLGGGEIENVISHKADDVIKDEYPFLWEEVHQFIKLIESVENSTSHYHPAMRKCKDFIYYHIYISFTSKNKKYYDDGNSKISKNGKYRGFVRESQDSSEIDIEFLLEAFNDISDEFDLEKLDRDPLSVGYMFVTDSNWQGNGFTFEYSEPRDRDSKYYQD